MDIVEQYIQKHGGKYHAGNFIGVSTTSGKYSFQQEKGLFNIDGSKISISINSSGGASEVADPYRIILYLKKNYQIELTIFPKNTIQRIISFFTSRVDKKNGVVKSRYKYSGNKQLIEVLVHNTEFEAMLKTQVVYLNLIEKHPSILMLTPAHGIDSVEQLELFLSTLKTIESELKTIF